MKDNFINLIEYSNHTFLEKVLKSEVENSLKLDIKKLYETSDFNFDTKVLSNIRKLYIENEELYRNKFDFLFNEYYLGTGNFNSKILMVGKELGTSLKRIEEEKYNPFYEFLLNQVFWKCNKDENKYPFSSNINNRFNPIKPYDGCVKKGRHTWWGYEKCVSKIINKYPNLKVSENKSQNDKFNFFFNSFITELNHIPSPLSIGNKSTYDRYSFLTTKIFNNFSIIIFSIGTYGSLEFFKTLFNNNNLELTINCNKSKNKFSIIKNNNQILIWTRHLSNGVSDSFFDDVINEIENRVDLKSKILSF